MDQPSHGEAHPTCSKHRPNPISTMPTSLPAVDLSSFDNSWYHPGRSLLVQAAWFFIGQPLLRSTIITSSSFRRALLRLFGARIGGMKKSG